MKTFIILKDCGIDVLTPMMGKPVVWYMVRELAKVGLNDVTLVGSLDCTKTIQELRILFKGEYNLDHVSSIEEAFDGICASPAVLVLYGDMPFLTSDTVKTVSEYHERHGRHSIVSAVHHPGVHDFDRVFDNEGVLTKIIDSADTWLPERLKKKIEYANAGVYVFTGSELALGINLLKSKDKLTDFNIEAVPNILRETGKNVLVCHLKKTLSEFMRVNSYAVLASATDKKRRIINGLHMAAGVRMIDPKTVYIDMDVEIEAGSVIYPSVILEGKCRIGKSVVLGPNTHLVNTVVLDGCTVRHSVLENVKIGSSTTVGPFAYLRADADIGDNCRIGNFVEIKNSKLGSGVKMAHLAYIGDADVGADVNYSCGAITCNYDGKKKYRTTIEDGAFIGSNSNLIAPVTIGKNSYVAAGSTITKNVDENALAIARGRQVQKDEWVTK